VSLSPFSLRRQRVAVALAGVLVAASAIHLLIPGFVPTAVAAESTRPPAPAGPRSETHLRGAATNAVARLRVKSISPKSGATGVGSTAPISIKFSAAISRQSTMPSLAPSVPGSWRVSGSTLTFTPDEPFVPLSDVTLTVPGGSGGVRAENGSTLTGSEVENFAIEDGSVLRLQQLLSLLDYSPLSWTPSGPAISATNIAGQLAAMYAPPVGRFAWESSGWPSSLTGLWQPGAYDVFTRGLVMSFQADHGLIVNGAPSAGLWNDMLSAIGTNEVNTGGYNYAVGDKVAPQTLTIYHDGTVVLRTSANTGIPQSPTPSGTFTVYARYRNYVMRGTNPNGVKYADPVQFVAYFYDGDAVHYFPRADYGIPQSLGCIELPLAKAAVAWSYLAYGTLITVIN